MAGLKTKSLSILGGYRAERSREQAQDRSCLAAKDWPLLPSTRGFNYQFQEALHRLAFMLTPGTPGIMSQNLYN